MGLRLLLLAVAVAYWPLAVSAGTAGRWAVVQVGVPLALLWPCLATLLGARGARFTSSPLVPQRGTPKLAPTGLAGRPRGLPDRDGGLLPLVLALLAYLATSLAWSASPWDTAGELLGLLFLLAAVHLARVQEDTGPALDAMAIGLWVSLPLAVAQRLGYHPLPDLEGYFSTVGGLFVTANALAEVSAASAVICLYRRRWVLAIGPILLAVLSDQREVYLMVATLPLLLGIEGRRLVALAAVPVLAVLAVGLAEPAWFHHLPAAIPVRLAIWRDVAGQFTLLGHGYGTFASQMPQYETAHSEFLQLAYEVGLASVVPAAGLVYLLVASPPCPARAGLAALSASALISAPLHFPATALLAAACVGGALGARDRALVAAPGGRADDAEGADVRNVAAAADG